MTIKNNEQPIVPYPRVPSIIVRIVLPLEILAIKIPTNGPRPKNHAHINIVHAFENSDLPNGAGPRLMLKKFLAINIKLSKEVFIKKTVGPKINMYINTHKAMYAQNLLSR